MAKNWTSVNLEQKFIENIKQYIKDRPEYSDHKEFIKESVRTHQRQLEQQEQKKLIQLLEQIIQNTDTDKEEIIEIIEENE